MQEKNGMVDKMGYYITSKGEMVKIGNSLPSLPEGVIKVRCEIMNGLEQQYNK
jgi:hypothetical protein